MVGQGRQPDLDCSASSFLESSKFTLSIHLSSLKPLFIFWLIYIQQYIKQNIVVVKKGEYDHNWITSLWAYHWQTKQWTCRKYKEERNIRYICKAPQSVTLTELVINPHSRWKLMQCLDLLRDIATKESLLFCSLLDKECWPWAQKALILIKPLRDLILPCSETDKGVPLQHRVSQWSE